MKVVVAGDDDDDCVLQDGRISLLIYFSPGSDYVKSPKIQCTAY